MERDPNYGRSQEAGDEMRSKAGKPGDPEEGVRELGQEPGSSVPADPDPLSGELSAQDERTWSILSHVSVLAWPLTGLLPIAPFIVWLFYKDRSPRIGFHALQSMWYQIAWFVLGTVGGFLATVFTVLTLGLGIFVIAPLAAILGLIPFAHQLYAAYKVSQGIDYRYPFIADKIDGGEKRAL